MCLCEFIKPCFEFQRNLKRSSSNKNRTENTLSLSFSISLAHTSAHLTFPHSLYFAQMKKADPTTQCKYTNNWLVLLLFKINSLILCIVYDSLLLCNLLETTSPNKHTHSHTLIHSFGGCSFRSLVPFVHLTTQTLMIHIGRFTSERPDWSCSAIVLTDIERLYYR